MAEGDNTNHGRFSKVKQLWSPEENQAQFMWIEQIVSSFIDFTGNLCISITSNNTNFWVQSVHTIFPA